MRNLILRIFAVGMMLGVAALALPSPSNAQYVITELIDANGDGSGNTLSNPREVATDSSGNVYVTGGTSDNAFKITPGGVITELIDANGDGGGRTLNSTRGVGVDSNGNVYVTGGVSDNAFKITPGGTITEIGDATAGLSSLRGVAVDSSGNVYVADFNFDGVFKIITPGTCSTTGTPCTINVIIDYSSPGGPPHLDAAFGVAVDSGDAVYVTGSNSDNAFRIDPNGAITEIIHASAGLSSPRGVAVDLSGNVYVAGGGTDNVFKITPGGTITEIIDATGGDGGVLTSPWGVAADSAGNVYVTGSVSDNAFKIATPGTCSTSGTPCTITEIIDATGGDGGTLTSPWGIAVDPNGNIYVTGSGSDNVFKLSSCGDGVIDGTEECDDGNTTSGDGCNAGCQLEAGWNCVGEPSTCTVLASHPATDSGRYSSSGFHNPADTDYSAAVGGSRSFFVFDLTSLTDPRPIVSASLVLETGTVSGGTFGGITYTLYDVSTPIPTLVAGGSGLTAIYDDLGSGVPYSAATEIGPGESDIEKSIPLVPAGVAAVGAAKGELVAIGGGPTGLGGNFAFGGTDVSDVQLLIEFGDPVIPTLSLWFQLALIAGLLGAGLGVWKWRGTSRSAP